MRSHPPSEEARCRDQHSAVTDLEALAYRLRPEGREEGAQNAAVLERAECRYVEFGHPGQQHENPVPDADPQVVKRPRKATGEVRELAVGDVAYAAVSVQAPKRDLASGRTDRVAVDGLVGHVDPACWKAVKVPPGRLPAEPGARRVVVDEVGRGRSGGPGTRGDRCPLHRRTESLGATTNRATVPCMAENGW